MIEEMSIEQKINEMYGMITRMHNKVFKVRNIYTAGRPVNHRPDSAYSGLALNRIVNVGDFITVQASDSIARGYSNRYGTYKGFRMSCKKLEHGKYIISRIA